jgi:hypothetical protein
MDFQVLIADSAIADLKEIGICCAGQSRLRSTLGQKAGGSRIEFGADATTFRFP